MTNATPTPARPKLAQRIWEWFSRADAVRTARLAQAERRQQLFCQRRARIACEVGERTLDPSTPWLSGSASHLAAGLFVEAIGWALRGASESAPSEDPSSSKSASPAELSQLAASHADLLLEAAGDPETLKRVLESAQQRGFEASALTEADTEQAARELGKVARALLLARAQHDALDQLYFQRLTRMGMVVGLVAAVLLGFLGLRDPLERRRDLSVGKAWVASSSYETVCQSPNHGCDASKSYFFHTQEESEPWLEMDLGRGARFSQVHVLNRQDCCADRAVPLVVESSTDHRHWRELARRTEVFDDWRASFAPVSARWLRVRATRRTILHLNDVRVLP